MKSGSISFSNKKFKQILAQFCMALAIIASVCGNAWAQPLEVNDDTMDLIIESVSMELVSNPALRDPFDNLPVGAFFTSIQVLSLSVDLNASADPVMSYIVRVPYQLAQGRGGDMMCTAIILNSSQGRKAERGDCYLEYRMNDGSNEAFNEEDEGILFDEL